MNRSSFSFKITILVLLALLVTTGAASGQSQGPTTPAGLTLADGAAAAEAAGQPQPRVSSLAADGSIEEWLSIAPVITEPRSDHCAVWTGTEMIIWGGSNESSTYYNTGARYNPATNTWAPVSMDGAPAGRTGFTAVWTGTEMLVWGGYNGAYTNTGGRYNPSTDTWAEIPVNDNTPSPRAGHQAVWTGTEMILWGGFNRYAGGYTNTGARYNPTTNTWTIIPVTTSTPAARSVFAIVWTGSPSTQGEMIVWGGAGAIGPLNTGGRYNPNTDTWTATAITADTPVSRQTPLGVWTGTEMIVWGGMYTFSTYNTGGRYNPKTDSWAVTAITADTPSPRVSFTMVWTGMEMLVWGGASSYTGSGLNTGGRYEPNTNTWKSITLTGAPTGRKKHTAVWTGRYMIVWGGSVQNDGGSYSIINNPNFLPVMSR